METAIDMMQGAINALLKLPTIILIWPAMNVLGWVLKKSNFPNRFIPVVVVLLPAVLMVFLLPFDPGQMNPGLLYPGTEFIIRCAGLGLIMGFLAWGTHKVFLRRLESTILGFDTSDTDVIDKSKMP